MDEWPTVTVADLGEVFDGPHATPKTVDEGPIFLGIGALKSGRLDLGETRHVTAEDFKKWTRRVEPRPGDIVFSYETRLGEAAIIPEGLRCCLGRRMGLVRVDPAKIHPRFFLYNYIAPHYQEFLRSRTVHGATVDRILLKEFPSFPFPCPPLEDQEKVVSLLGALDDKIELNRKTNETLEALARAIFKDWFVDFGPTRARAEGRAPYLAPALWDLFPGRLDAEGKPEGWDIKPFSDLFTIIGGGTPKKSVAEYWNGDILWFSVVDAPPTGEIYVVDTATRITEKGLDESSARLVRAGTTIISARGTVGKLAMARHAMTFNQSCYGLQGQDGVGDRFVYLSAQHMVGRLQAMAHGSVFSTITRDTFAALDFVRASDALFVAFEETVEPLFERIGAHVEESRTLAQTRDLLLPKLMSGEIRLRDAERMVEDAA